MKIVHSVNSVFDRNRVLVVFCYTCSRCTWCTGFFWGHDAQRLNNYYRAVGAAARAFTTRLKYVVMVKLFLPSSSVSNLNELDNDVRSLNVGTRATTARTRIWFPNKYYYLFADEIQFRARAKLAQCIWYYAHVYANEFTVILRFDCTARSHVCTIQVYRTVNGCSVHIRVQLYGTCTLLS